MNPSGRDAIREYNIANGLVKSTRPTTTAQLPPVLATDARPDDAPALTALTAMTPEQRAAFERGELVITYYFNDAKIDRETIRAVHAAHDAAVSGWTVNAKEA